MHCYKTLILLFCGYSLNFCSKFPPRKYYYIDKLLTWAEAQQLCRENYTDLATFKSKDDINSLEPAFSYPWAWIGLSDDPQSWKYAMGNESNSWRWTTTNETSKTGYSNWKTNEPQFGGAVEPCAAMFSGGKWGDLKCIYNRSFICYNVTNKNGRTYALITDNKPWHAALEYCRTHHTDLAMIENAEENNEVSAAKPDAVAVWIGLYRVPWTWSDKSPSSFENWGSGQPDNYGTREPCVAENELHEWNDAGCQHKFIFICHQVTRVERKMVRVKFQTDADISDPAISTQILQKLSAAAARQGWTDVNLQWRIQPRKLAEDGVESKESGGPPGRIK